MSNHSIHIEHLIGLIDQKVNRQINAVLHHPKFQQLESSWRGLLMLVNEAAENNKVLIRFLNISYIELNRDVSHAIEFDQSQIFRKIYSEEYDQPGGLPYGLLIGDYYFSHKPVEGVADGIDLLANISQITASAFVPFISSACPTLFGLNSFTEFQAPFYSNDLFRSSEYHRLRKLRQEEDSRFLGLTLPKILMRPPYNANGIKLSQRFFKEELKRHDDYLWGNAAYAYGCIIIKCFKETGWFANIRGAHVDGLAGGSVALARDYFSTDKKGLIPKCSVEFQLSDKQEKLLSDAGFLAIQDNRLMKKGIFYSSQSLQLPKNLQVASSSANAKISAMLHYILCVSRFSHYIKVMIRDKVGKFISPVDCEKYLARWLKNYCSSTQSESIEARARYPLNDAKVEVREQKGKPGKYFCTIHLKPQYQLDVIDTYLKLITQIKLS